MKRVTPWVCLALVLGFLSFAARGQCITTIGEKLVVGTHTYAAPYVTVPDQLFLRDGSFTGNVRATKLCIVNGSGYAYLANGTCSTLAVPSSAVACPTATVPTPPAPPVGVPPPVPVPPAPVPPPTLPPPVNQVTLLLTLAPAYWSNYGPPPYGDPQLQWLAAQLTDYYLKISYGAIKLDVRVLPLRRMSLPAPLVCPGVDKWLGLNKEAFPGLPYHREILLIETPACSARMTTSGYWMMAWHDQLYVPELVHEIGHSFGLSHSWANGNVYGSTTDIMGNTQHALSTMDAYHRIRVLGLPPGTCASRTLRDIDEALDTIVCQPYYLNRRGDTVVVTEAKFGSAGGYGWDQELRATLAAGQVFGRFTHDGNGVVRVQ